MGILDVVGIVSLLGMIDHVLLSVSNVGISRTGLSTGTNGL